MKLNFDKVLFGLDGKAIQDEGEDVILAKSLANNLVNGRKGDAVKFYDWAMTLYKTRALDLDRSDWEVLKNFIKGMDEVSILYKAQLLEQFVLTTD